MKKIIFLTIALVVFGFSAVQAAGNQPIDIQVKTLYSTPSESSNIVYQIPIDVKLQDISEDGNWYKVKISYRIGPIFYNYVGWTNLPISDILAERQSQPVDTAAATPPTPDPK